MRTLSYILRLQEQIRKYDYLLGFMLICCVFYMTGLKFCYHTHNLNVINACFYTFCHANIFHLAANLYALWCFRPRPYTFIIALAIAMITPLFSALDTPTLGASAMIMAAYSRKYVAWHKSWIGIILFNASLLLINYIFIGTETMCFNVIAHIMSFSIGYIYWTIHYKIISIWKEN